MKRVLVLALGLLFVPALVSAQLEVGVDAGLSFESIDDFDDSAFDIDIPTSGIRLGFAAGETLIVETLLDFGYGSFGDLSATSLALVPGVNFLLGEQFYVRGEAGLLYSSFDDGTSDDSATQYLFGGAAGLRNEINDNVIFRLEGGVDRLLENEDEFIPASWVIRVVAGISGVIG
jgi:hypothetical protein